MRNRIVHEYFGVDLQIVWKVIKRDLKKFEDNCAKFEKDYKYKFISAGIEERITTMDAKTKIYLLQK